MKPKILLCLSLFFLLVSMVNGQTDTVRYGDFGNVVLYKPAKAPNSVVLFVSGDGGWNLGVVEMARILEREGAMVAGIDIRRYYRNIKHRPGTCYYPASDFEDLSIFVQKKLKLPQYFKPILLGYSSGATLVYGILKQAPANTFKGAISLGFCPDIEIDRPLCKGSGLKWHDLKPGRSYYLETEGNLTAPFIILQGMIDKVCSFEEAQTYLKGVPMAELVALPKVGHGFAVESNWVGQYKESFRKVLNTPGYAEQKAAENLLLKEQALKPLDTDLPLTLVPTALHDTMPMAFMISGDGGWTSFDQALAEKLAAKGIPVVGMDAQKYFWNEKTPDETSAEIAKAAAHYMQQWNRKKWILVGYSFGANIVPYVANRLPQNLSSGLLSVIMMSPDITADFEIHVADMLSIGKGKEKYEIIPEIKRIRQARTASIFGDEEEPETPKAYVDQKIKVYTLPGSHHYNEDFGALSETIVKAVRGL